MVKMTVRFPPALKRALEDTGRAMRITEAQLIREGVAAVTKVARPPQPTIPLFASGLPGLAERVDEALEGFGQR